MNVYEQTQKFRNFIQTGVYNNSYMLYGYIDKISLAENFAVLLRSCQWLAYSMCMPVF